MSNIFSISSYYFNPFALPVLVAGSLMLFLGLYVFIRNLSSLVNFSFFLLSLSMATWLLGTSMMYISKEETLAKWWYVNLAFLGVASISQGIYFYTISTFKAFRVQKWIMFMGYQMGLLYYFLTASSGYVVIGMKKFFWGWNPLYGSHSILFVSMFFVFAAASACNYFIALKRRQFQFLLRQQIKLTLIGLLIASIGTLDYIPHYGINFYPFGYLPVTLFMFIIVYGMQKYQLMSFTPALAVDTILANVPESVIVFDKEEKIGLVNSSTCAILGYNYDELVGKPVQSIFAGQVITPDTLRKLISDKAVHYDEAIFLSKSQARIPVSLSISPIKNRLDETIGFVSVVRDTRVLNDLNSKLMNKSEALEGELAERHAVEVLLWEARQRLFKITDAVPGMVFEAKMSPGGEMGFLFASKGTQDLFGVNPDDFIGDLSLGWKMIVREDQERIRESLLVALKSRSLWKQEFRITLEGAAIKWVHGTAALLRIEDDGGAMWAGAFLDITDLKRQEAALQESEENFRLIVENINDLIFELSASGRIEYVSKNVERYGYKPEDLVGKHLNVTTPASEIPKALQFLGLIFSGKTPPTFEINQRDSSGNIVPMEVNVAFVRKKSEIKLALGIMRDLTERKKAEQSMKQLNESLEKAYKELKAAHTQLEESLVHMIQAEKMVALGELTAGVAHELNQPLNVIKMICQTELRDIGKQSPAGGDEDINKDLCEIVNQVDKMAGIIKHMRIFSRSTGGTLEQEYDINMLVSDALRFIRQQYKDHNIELAENFSPNLKRIMIDPVRVEQVLLNLLNNARYAVEHSGKGQKRIEIKTYTCASGKEVAMEVIDNGTGIAEEVKPKIFQPFFSTKDPGQGTGLGLSISHKIIEEHKGRIEFESRSGEGTVFRVILPAKE